MVHHDPSILHKAPKGSRIYLASENIVLRVPGPGNSVHDHDSPGVQLLPLRLPAGSPGPRGEAHHPAYPGIMGHKKEELNRHDLNPKWTQRGSVNSLKTFLLKLKDQDDLALNTFASLSDCAKYLGTLEVQ